MTDFDFDVKDRKDLARQARYRKNGSKSKKCSLPSENMTHKQWKEQCGPVEIYQMDIPMTWKELKTYPERIQKEYISGLSQKYGVTLGEVSSMLGVAPSTLRSHGLSVYFSKYHRMSNEQMEQWKDFLSKRASAGFLESQTDTYTKGDNVASDTSAVDERTSTRTMRIPKGHTQFTVEFSGEIDICDVTDFVRQIVGNNLCGKISISIQM